MQGYKLDDSGAAAAAADVTAFADVLLLLLMVMTIDMTISVTINIFQGNISFRFVTLEFDSAPSDGAEEAVTQDHVSSGEEDQDLEHSESTQEQELSVVDGNPNENATELSSVTAPSASPSEKSTSGN